MLGVWLKSSQYTLIIPHRVIQLLHHSGSQRQGCTSHNSTNRSIPSEAKVHPITNQLCWLNFFLGLTDAPNYVCEANVCPIKNGLYAAGSTGNDPDLTGQTACCRTREKHYFSLPNCLLPNQGKALFFFACIWHSAAITPPGCTGSDLDMTAIRCLITTCWNP